MVDPATDDDFVNDFDVVVRVPTGVGAGVEAVVRVPSWEADDDGPAAGIPTVAGGIDAL